jgi:hypothetical protein
MQVAQTPPQSTPVSLPFFVPSVHVGALQTALTQTPLAQSSCAVQGASVAHFWAHVGPPQSTPTSSPFFCPSVHVGAMHVFIPEHTLLLQSVFTMQGCPSAHGTHRPPQSTADSIPSCVLFVHPEGTHVSLSQTFPMPQFAVVTHGTHAPKSLQ